MAKRKPQSLIPDEQIERSILLLRGHRVILDADLAVLYGVTTARLNQQVRRNMGIPPGRAWRQTQAFPNPSWIGKPTSPGTTTMAAFSWA
ncbi:MAG: ORF6N domain-containing protein [Pirellulaceae bacterium]|nr:ORF6N domain-containing protein [Pirellulaceae bacterium]